jgi:hypothetical protein
MVEKQTQKLREEVSRELRLTRRDIEITRRDPEATRWEFWVPCGSSEGPGEAKGKYGWKHRARWTRARSSVPQRGRGRGQRQLDPADYNSLRNWPLSNYPWTSYRGEGPSIHQWNEGQGSETAHGLKRVA